jgi:flagellar biosynthesis chaperone FliJ
MATPTQLDPVLRFRERAEDEARRQQAAAEEKVASLTRQLADARARRDADRRTGGDATLWVLEEAAHERAGAECQALEQVLVAVRATVTQAVAKVQVAHRDVEAVRRIADRRVAEARREADHRELREQDDLAMARARAS